MHYYQFNIGDYKAHTEHLELMEDLAFRRMMDWCYLHEKPLPLNVDEIAKLIRMRTHTESIAYVLETYFERIATGYVNTRITKEVAKYQEKSEKAKKSAQARWKNKSNENNNKANANALQAQSEGYANHKPITINQEPVTNNKSAKLPKFSQDDLDCANWFYGLLKKLNPNHKKPNIENWADDIRKIVNIDNRSYNEISDLMLWVNQDGFWSTNVLSPNKLRDKWDQLIIAKNKRRNGVAGRTESNLQAMQDFINE